MKEKSNALELREVSTRKEKKPKGRRNRMRWNVREIEKAKKCVDGAPWIYRLRL